MNTARKRVASGMVVALAALLSACGGDPDPPPVTSEVPQSASQSVNGFIAYLQALIAAPADTLEPVNTSMVTGPTDDTIEPQKVD
jgi:PBP1b-binding outer membrane lipoprotein LpoB